MEESVITDEAMKEMADQLKSKYDEIMEMTEKLKEENKHLKKDLMTLYSLFRIIDNLIEDDFDVDPSVKMICELSRSIASSMIDHHIKI